MELPKLDPGSHGSPFADQLHRGFARLRFSGSLLEKEFRAFYLAQNLPRARLSGLIALILVLAVTSIDLVLGVQTAQLNTLRLGVLCPLVAVIGIAISLPGARRYYTEVAAIG